MFLQLLESETVELSKYDQILFKTWKATNNKLRVDNFVRKHSVNPGQDNYFRY